MSRKSILAALLLLAPVLWASDAVFIPAGTRVPFFSSTTPGSRPFKRDSITVPAFWMDRYAVTKSDFLKFVKAHPEWRKSRAQGLFADSQYLDDWKDDLRFGDAANEGQRPVTHVSWFAARAYCQARGKELPTTDQWEYVAYDRGQGSAKALDWFTQPNATRLPSVQSVPPNGYGVSGLYGVIWEWTLDFNGAMPIDDDGNLFCGSGSQGATDSSDYAGFLRYGFRSSLKANYTTENLGFRCVSGSAR